MKFLFLLLSLCAIFISCDDTSAPAKNDDWADTDMTTHLWRLISSHDIKGLKQLLETQPDTVNVRSGDGRGALFWAYEYGNEDAVKLLLANKADPEIRDVHENLPVDLDEGVKKVVGEKPTIQDDDEIEDDDDDDDDDDDEKFEAEAAAAQAAAGSAAKKDL